MLPAFSRPGAADAASAADAGDASDPIKVVKKVSLKDDEEGDDGRDHGAAPADSSTAAASLSSALLGMNNNDVDGFFNSYCDTSSVRADGLWLPTGRAGDKIADNAPYGKDGIEYILSKFKQFLDNKMYMFLTRVGGHCGRKVDSFVVNTLNLISGNSELASKMMREGELTHTERENTNNLIARKRRAIRSKAAAGGGSPSGSGTNAAGLSRGLVSAKQMATASTTVNISYRSVQDYDENNRRRGAAAAGEGDESDEEEEDEDDLFGSDEDKDDDDEDGDDKDDKEERRRRRREERRRRRAGPNGDLRFEDRLNVPGMKNIPPNMLSDLYPNIESYDEAFNGGRDHFIDWLTRNGRYTKEMQGAIDQLFPDVRRSRADWGMLPPVSGFYTLEATLVAAISRAKMDIQKLVQERTGNDIDKIKELNAYNLIHFYLEEFALAVGMQIYLRAMLVSNLKNSPIYYDSKSQYLNAINSICDDLLSTDRISQKISPSTLPVMQFIAKIPNSDEGPGMISDFRKNMLSVIKSGRYSPYQQTNYIPGIYRQNINAIIQPTSLSS